MKIKTRLTVEAIVRWEQMTGRSFLRIDFSDEGDMRKLLYCATVVCADTPFAYAEFAQTLENKKIVAAALRSLSLYNDFTAQFARTEAAEADRPETPGAQETTIGAVAARLIVTGGMDARYVMHEMLVQDIPLFIEALNERIRHEEESRRLWTFHTMRPHIDGRKIKNPQQIHLFPWEAEEAERKAREEMERNEAEFRRFISGELMDINSIQWRKKSDYEQ